MPQPIAKYGIRRLAQVPGHLHLLQVLSPLEARIVELAHAGMSWRQIVADLNERQNSLIFTPHRVRRIIRDTLQKIGALGPILFTKPEGAEALYRAERWGKTQAARAPRRTPETFYFFERWGKTFQATSP